jgi:histidinol-phosphatase (PHP family)
MLFNLHTHTSYSDGSSSPEEYLKEALRLGFSVLGFSDHSPVPFDNDFAIKKEQLGEYVNAIHKLSPTPVPSPIRERRREIEILLGLEIDFIPGLTESTDFYRQAHDFDYFIGSVHLVKNSSSGGLWFIDGPQVAIYDQGLKDHFNGDIRQGVRSYYHQINEMIITQKPDIIGHLDKIKMHNRNRYFRENESWYIQLVDETLDVIKENQCIVEVNTRGLYKKRSDSLFPGPEILKKILAMKIPVTISTDAHKPAELSMGIEEARKALSEIGFKVLSIITSEGWNEVPLF